MIFDKIIFRLFFVVVILISLGNTSSKPAPTVYYKMDSEASNVFWRSPPHNGTLKIKSLNMDFVDGALIAANCSIDMTSITDKDIDYEMMKGTLENVLKSEDFFNVEKYPEAHFELFAVSPLEENTYEVLGDFIIFDTPICHEFEAEIVFKNDSLYFDTKPIILDRTDWGMYYLSPKNPAPKDGENGFVVSDTITVQIKLRAAKLHD